MKLATILATAALVSPLTINTGPPASSLRIDISIDRTTITLGQNIQLTIKLVNLTDHEVAGNFTDINGIDMTDVLHIRNSEGKELTPASYHGQYDIRPRGGDIAPHGERERQTVIPLGSFGLNRPGIYTLQVTRLNFEDKNAPQAVSNIVTLHVDAPKQ